MMCYEKKHQLSEARGAVSSGAEMPRALTPIPSPILSNVKDGRGELPKDNTVHQPLSPALSPYQGERVSRLEIHALT